MLLSLYFTVLVVWGFVAKVDCLESRKSSTRKKDLYRFGNTEIHLNNTHKYAHFSYITMGNKHKYPLLQLAKSEEQTLNAGECMYIPPTWWHWVISYGETYSINFWPLEGAEKEYFFSNQLFENYTESDFLKPFTFEFQFQNASLFWNPQYFKDIFNNEELFMWHTLTNQIALETFDAFAHNPQYKYLITLPGYNVLHSQHNKEKLKRLVKDFNELFPIEGD